MLAAHQTDDSAESQRRPPAVEMDEQHQQHERVIANETPSMHEDTGNQATISRSAGTCGARSISGTNAGSIELRLLVRRREAGALIGKRGANIKRLRQLFSESAFNIPDTGNGPERIVCVHTNSLEQLQPILVELSQLFHEKQASQLARNSTPLIPAARAPERPHRACELIELKLLVNASHAGLLIGVGGQSIRKLRNDSKAAIKIYEMCCPLSSERVCAIKAQPPVVVSAIKMVLEILALNPIKGTHKPYDALNFDLSLVDRYGGYAPDEDDHQHAVLASHPLLQMPSTPPSLLSPVGFPPPSLEFLQQKLQCHEAEQQAHATPFMLRDQAAQLLAAAFASQRADGPVPSSPARANRFGGMVEQCDRYAAAAAAAMVAEKYHSLMRAGQHAIVANRFHPYYTFTGSHPVAPGKYQHHYSRANLEPQMARRHQSDLAPNETGPRSSAATSVVEPQQHCCHGYRGCSSSSRDSSTCCSSTTKSQDGAPNAPGQPSSPP